MDILDLLEIKTQKQLRRYVRKNSPACKRITKHFAFKASFFGVDFVVFAQIIERTVNAFQLMMDSEKYSYEQMAENVLKIKDELTKIAGQPKTDNTNNLNCNDIEVGFETESAVFYLSSLHNQTNSCAFLLVQNKHNFD